MYLYKHVLIEILNNEHSSEENIERRFKVNETSCGDDKLRLV